MWLEPVNEAPEIDPPGSLISNIRSLATENGENSDKLNFSEFLSAQTDGSKATTSTPFPVRQIDTNKSPKRPANVQLTAADSPQKLFVPSPSRIPVTTPRTSRHPSNSGRRAKLPCDRKEMLSPTSVVSSTIDIVSENEESETAKFLEREGRVNENANQNCLPFDEDQQGQHAGTRNSDEVVFRSPELVRRPLLKQDDDQPKISNASNISQRNKKPRPMVNPLLEDYIKVGESIINRKNGVPLENSSSSTRRKLYRKGDFCNEEDIIPLDQPSFVLNPISAGDAEEEVQLATIKQPSTKNESKVRQVRSQNKKTQSTGTTSSKTSRRGAVRSKLQKVEGNAESEENELSAKQTRKEMPTKSQSEPVHSTQQEAVENEHPESEQMVEEPCSLNVKRANVEYDQMEAGELVTQPATTSNSKEKKKRPNAEDDVLETDGEKATLPTEPQPKTRKKRRRVVEVSAAKEPDEPQIEGDTRNEVRPTAKSKVRKSRKRKLPTAADANSVSNGDFPSTVDGSMAKKRRRVSKWENIRSTKYDSLKPREADSGVRRSTRERRLPTSNLLMSIPQ